MSETLVLLRVEHRNFLRVIDVLDDLIAELRGEAPVEVDVLREVLEYFQGYPDRCHHPKEDLLFRRLEEKYPDIARRVGNLLGDHSDLSARLGDSMRRVRAAEGAPDPELADNLAVFSDHYRRHMEAEENIFFPITEEAFNQDDWAAIDFTVFDLEDPIFDAPAEQHYRQLRHAIFEKHPPRELFGEAGESQ